MNTEVSISAITGLIVFFTVIGTAFSYYWKLREEILQLKNRVENLEKVYPQIEKIALDIQKVKEELAIIITKIELQKTP